jgi:hypothetical protein
MQPTPYSKTADDDDVWSLQFVWEGDGNSQEDDTNMEQSKKFSWGLSDLFCF